MSVGSIGSDGESPLVWCRLVGTFPAIALDLEHDGFELNRRECSDHLAPLAGRGRILREAKNPGEGVPAYREVSILGESPSPRPSFALG